jgi:AcrR family transcriptional regulator
MAYRKKRRYRGRILKAAIRLFNERGYYETGIGDIAKAAGIGRASFYYYFDDKEKAARAVFDSYVDRIYAAANEAVPREEVDVDSREDMETLVLSTLVKYILLFKYVALNPATHAVYYDLAITRLRRSK